MAFWKDAAYKVGGKAKELGGGVGEVASRPGKTVAGKFDVQSRAHRKHRRLKRRMKLRHGKEAVQEKAIRPALRVATLGMYQGPSDTDDILQDMKTQARAQETLY